MKTFLKSVNLQAGFSLVEMAIVLMIVGLLLGGLLPMLSGQMEQKNRNETRKQLEEISAALLGYAASQSPPKLPCPANPSIATGSNGAGVSDCTIATATGVVPWVTLGTSETDAWGRRFTYSVASSVTGTFATSFKLSDTGNLKVLSASTGACPNTNCVGNNITAVIISHGVNGAGAYTPQGGAPLSASTDLDETDNSDADTNFVSHDQSSTFDDLVIWLSPNILFNRMVAAGKLP